jgi:hypothetical protein
MKTTLKEIPSSEDRQPKPTDILVNSTPVQEGRKLENKVEKIKSFSLAPVYSKDQLREVNRRILRFSRNQKFSIRLRLEARPY